MTKEHAIWLLQHRADESGGEIHEAYVMAIKALSQEPTEDKSGKWINDENHIPICNKCGYIPPYDRAIDDYEYSNFCPNCGAKMESEE